MNKISSGLLMLLGAGALGVFWANGYLATWTAQITGQIGGSAPKTPIVLPKLGAAVRRGTGFGVAPVPPVPPIGGIA